MALSGKINGGTCTGVYGYAVDCWIAWVVNSQSVTGNYSNITVQLNIQVQASKTLGTFDNDHYPAVTMTVKGSSVTPTRSHVDVRNHRLCTVAEYTGNVSHNADGTLSLPLAASFDSSSFMTNITGGSASGNASVTAIPKASTVAISPSGTSSLRVGQRMDVTVTRAVSTYRDTVKFYIGSTYLSGYDLTFGSETTKQMLFEDDVSNYFSTTSGTATLAAVCTTTDGNGNTVGTSTSMYQIKISLTAYPTMNSSSVAPNNGTLPSAFSSLYIKGISKVRATASATAKYGASIDKYAVWLENAEVQSSASPVDTAVIQSAGSQKLVGVRAYDTRGLMYEAQYHIDALDYSYPTIIPNGGSSVVCARCDAQGNLSDIGEYLKVAAIANYANITGNSVTFSYAVKATSDSTYPAATAFASNIVDGVVSGVSLSTATSYNVKLTATDALGNSAVPYEITISKTVPTFHLKDGGLGAAFGRNAETDNLLDVAWNVRIRGNLQVDGNGAGGTVFAATLSNNTVTLANSKTLADIVSAWNGGQNEVFILTAEGYKFRVGRVSTYTSSSYTMVTIYTDPSVLTTMSSPTIHFLYVPGLSSTGTTLQYVSKLIS